MHKKAMQLLGNITNFIILKLFMYIFKKNA